MRSYVISFLLSLCTSISISTQAQTNNFNIRLAPLSLIDIYSGSCYKGGIELKIFKNNSITLEGGGYFRNFNGLKNIKGHVLDFGIRHYIENNLSNNGIYLSVNYFYKEQSFDYGDSILITPDYFKEYRVHKFVNCINLNFGICAISEQNLFIDFYAGIGVRTKKIKFNTDNFGN